MAEPITLTIQPPEQAPPTVTQYQQFVVQAMAALDQILAITPKLDEAETSERKIAPSRLGVPDAAIATVIAAVEQLPGLASSNTLDPVAARDALQYLEALRPLVDKIATVQKRLRFAIMWKKSSLVGEAQQVYRIAKSFASNGRSPLMAAHVANMKRDFARKVPTKAAREERKIEKLREAAELQQKEVKTA